MSARKYAERGGAGVAVLLLLAIVVNALTPIGARANHTPADKVVASGSKLVVSGPNAEVPILTATLRTSSPTDRPCPWSAPSSPA